MKNLTVPINKEAMERLNYNVCVNGDLIEISLNDKEYLELWNLGILDRFNQSFNIMIDDFEDEVIENLNNLELAKRLNIDYIKKYPNSNVLTKLLSQIELALSHETGLFFYF